MLRRFLLILSTCIILCTNGVAQFGSTMSSTIKTPYGQVRVPNVAPLTYFPIARGSNGIQFKKYEYTVLLKSGEVYQGKGKIQVYKGKSYIKFYQGKKFRLFNPKDTKEIFRMLPAAGKMAGYPSFNDSCWLFKVSQGKISKYAIAPEMGTSYVCAIQKDNKESPKAITQENVIEMVEDNAEALKNAKKNKLMDAIRIGSVK